MNEVDPAIRGTAEDPGMLDVARVIAAKYEAAAEFSRAEAAGWAADAHEEFVAARARAFIAARTPPGEAR